MDLKQTALVVGFALLFALQALMFPHLHPTAGAQHHPTLATTSFGAGKSDAGNIDAGKVASAVEVSSICGDGDGTPQGGCDHADCAICTNQTDRHAALFLVAAAITIIAPPRVARDATPPFAATHLPDDAIDIAAGAPRAPPLS